VSESTSCVSVATIIPTASLNPNSPLPTVGTRVMLSDGSELTGITSITITAEPGGVWKATITVMPHNVEPVTAEVMVVEAVEEVAPDEHLLEVTAFSDRVRRYVPAPMQEHGLEPMEYSFICHNIWPQEIKDHPADYEQIATTDAETGETIYQQGALKSEAWTEVLVEEGDRYSFRSDGLLAFIAAGFEARLAALEASM
jgi:hypothetical protein